MPRVFVKGDHNDPIVTITGLGPREKKKVPLWLRELPISGSVGAVRAVEPSEDGAIVVRFSKSSSACAMAEAVRSCLIQNGLNQKNGLAVTNFKPIR